MRFWQTTICTTNYVKSWISQSQSSLSKYSLMWPFKFVSERDHLETYWFLGRSEECRPITWQWSYRITSNSNVWPTLMTILLLLTFQLATLNRRWLVCGRGISVELNSLFACSAGRRLQSDFTLQKCMSNRQLMVQIKARYWRISQLLCLFVWDTCFLTQTTRKNLLGWQQRQHLSSLLIGLVSNCVANGHLEAKTGSEISWSVAGA